MLQGIKVKCGDWLYPSRETTCRVVYPIDRPLVAEIFLPKDRIGKPVCRNRGIGHHLTGPRFVELDFDDQLLNIVTLKNEREESFECSIGHEFIFDLADLARSKRLPDGSCSDEASVFFADVLLHAHLQGATFPPGITFREATIPEIESIGTW